MGFTTQVTGLAEVETHFKKYLAVLGDLSQDLMEGVREFGAIEAEVFDSNGRGQWQPDSPMTQEYKAQEGFGGRTMVRTGQLRSSLVNPTIFGVTPSTIDFGSRDRAIKFHKHGFRQVWTFRRRGDGGLMLARRQSEGFTPARDPAPLTPGDRRRISFRVAISLRRRLRGAA